MNQSETSKSKTERRIVAGIDGSRQAADAALWAGAFAARRGAPLHLLYAFRSARSPSLLGGSRAGEYVQRRTEYGEALLEEARREILARFPRVLVTADVAEGDPARLLVGLSYDASVVVAGTRGGGGFGGLLLGSVGLRLAAHCHCPAVFVPGAAGGPAASPGAPLVLGVVEDEPDTVVDFAFRTAADLGVGVRLVHAWEPIELRPGYYLIEPAFVEAEARQLLDGTLKRVPAERFPDVAVTAAAVRGAAAGALRDAARGAPLLVVGAHRARSPVSVGVGAVVHALLSHACCPVAVVPAALFGPVA
jgi:nucleotide-binding universal stress UspA family protein